MVRKLGEKDLYKKGNLQKDFVPVPSRQIIGQDKALNALNFAVNLSAPNAHLVCLGPKGVGRTSLTLDILRQFAENKPTPSDWIYVTNFDELLCPIPVALPAGQGSVFAKKMAHLAETVREGLKTLFSDENYQIGLAHIKQKYAAEKQADFNRLAACVATPQTVLSKTSEGVMVSPVKNGQVLGPDAFNHLPVEERKGLLSALKQAQDRLEKALKESTFDATQENEEVQAFRVQLAEKLLDKKWAPLHKNYDTITEIKAFLSGAKKYILENLNALQTKENESAWRLLQANVLVSNDPEKGAPVIAMGHMTLGALLGKIEREQWAGSLISDHLLIQAGALHRANGGFLVIEAKDLVNAPFVWQALKQALYTHKIQMESADDGIYAVKTLQPQPIPLNLKVVLVGEPALYYALSGKEEDFEELFKLEVRFNERMPRTAATEKAYACVLADFVVRNQLIPFDTGAYNRLTEFAAYLAEEQNELSTRLVRVHDLMREADFMARQRNVKKVGAAEVEAALQARLDRLSAAHEEWLNTAKQGVLKLNVSGTAIGQINALVVHELGAFQFGRPSRVTCRVRLGSGNVADIEREVSLGGTLHSKGVLILGAYLSAKYGQEYSLPVDASLVWEQSYSELDGDSASSAELYALLSAIGEIPLNQSVAVTGSVNQMGEIQAVGALNEKIEGFFDACVALGLNGKQGVLIPAASVSNLMLADRVRRAVADKKFHLWSAETIEEGFAFLTGLTPAMADKKITEALSHYHYLTKK